MNEKVAWIASNAWDVRWYVVVLVIRFGLGLYSQPKHVCPSCPTNGGGMGEVVKTLIIVNAEDVANMSQVDGLCDVNGTPIIRMFSTSWCPHCQWAGPTFEEVARENAGKAIFRHYDVETGDDLLTPDVVETAMGMGEFTLYDQLGSKSIPMYTFGCQYYRVGNAYEQQNDLVSEKQAFQDGVDLVAQEDVPTGLLRGDGDEHGCIGSAGYSWCEVKQKCLRVGKKHVNKGAITSQNERSG